jgi:hypothetical protein
MIRLILNHISDLYRTTSSQTTSTDSKRNGRESSHHEHQNQALWQTSTQTVNHYEAPHRDEAVSARLFVLPERAKIKNRPTTRTVDLADVASHDDDTPAVPSEDNPTTDTIMTVKPDSFRVFMKMFPSSSTLSSDSGSGTDTAFRGQVNWKQFSQGDGRGRLH